MHVINLLPWREALYRRRRRQFLLAVLATVSAGIVVAAFSYESERRSRSAYDAHIGHLQADLSHLEQDYFFLVQSSAEMTAVSDNLTSRRRQRMQQLEWRHLMHEWQQLSAEVRISEISWSGDAVALHGVSEVVDPLRRLVNESAQWQLQQIELNAQSRYHFVVSRTLQYGADI